MTLTDPAVVAVLSILGFIVAYGLLVLALAGGDLGRISLARRSAFKILRDGEFAAKADALLNPPPPRPQKPDGTPLRALVLLQREGRLLDFLMEDVSGASDGQLGAGVRVVHDKCRAALKKHLELESIYPQEKEEESVEVKAGFDPSAIQLTGNVTGQPPFRGTLKHAGWRVKEIRLAAPGEGVDEMVVQPAEVELP